MNKKSYYYNIISLWYNKRYISIFIVNLLLLPTFPYIVFAQDTLKHNMNEVIVTAGRRPVLYDKVNRSIIVIDNQQVERVPVNNVQDVLEYAGGIDLRQRGINGTQADVAIRGGTFEQTLILIDGIKIIDPQTGHYNLNLPLSMESLERVEILKGEGSRIHGPNAFSGAINFIPRKDLTKGLSIGIAGGQNGYYSGSLSGSYNLGNWGNNIAIEKLKSDGYRENTEFGIINFFYNSTLVINPGRINLFFGINEKDVGANSFYSARFPLQADYTKTKFLSIKGDFGIDGCMKGWFYICIDENDQYEFDIITSFQEIEQITINASIVLVDIPIGLREVDPVERLCDLEARKVLGNRKSSVFPASSRLALVFNDYAEASQINFHHTGRRLSKQSFAISSKIEEVDKFIISSGLQGKFREMHPEVCFWALNGFTPMEFSKKKNDGFNVRMELLNKYFSNTDKLVEDSRCRFLKKELAKDDILDALVGAVSARFYPNLLTLPDLPELDNKGLKMEIVYPSFADYLQ